MKYIKVNNMIMNKNKAIISVLAILLLSSFAVMAVRYLRTLEHKTAKIYQNGEIIREINLDTLTEPIEFEITDESGHKNAVRAEKGRIRITSADCPDKVCVNMGWIENGVVPIVCLPNKVTIEITGANSDIDARTGG